MLGRSDQEIDYLIEDGRLHKESGMIPVAAINSVKHEDELRDLLEEIVRDTSKISLASRQLRTAALDYRATWPIKDADGKRSRFTVAEERSAIGQLHTKLIAARDAAKSLPLNALSTFADEYKTPVEIETPIEPEIPREGDSIEFVDPRELGASLGKLSKDLENMVAAAERALAIAKSRPDKPPDYDRSILAWQVAQVFREVLQINPASTRDHVAHLTFERGGASYARVLRITFKMAGIYISDHADLGRHIDAGISLLNDPESPHNL